LTGLRTFRRDLDLPRRCGDGTLTLPSEDEFRALLQRYLVVTTCEPTQISLLHARWKPGVAVVGLYEVSLEDGARRWVGWKRYSGAKGPRIASELDPDARASAAASPLCAAAPLPEGDGYLWTFPADRVLRGAQRAFEPTRLARRFDRAGLGGSTWTLRKRATTLVHLRYKPERRVVARLDAKLRSESGERSARTFGLRLLPLDVATRVAELRLHAGLHAGEHLPAPALLAFDRRDGVLWEEWLQGETPRPDCFEHARAAGRALAALHAVPPPAGTIVERSLCAEREAALTFLARFVALPTAPDDVSPRVLRARGLVHGDMHPDQLLRSDTGPRLLDLDTLRAGAPEEDLGSWIADHLTESPGTRYTDAAAELVRGYVSAGGTFDGALLAAVVSCDLLARACAALRRLEEGALEKAAHLVARSRAVEQGEDGP
jgi:aminoglycoside phosphotransferase (APT) family kinase protein